MIATRRAMFLIENVDIEAATGIPGARWEYFQLAQFNDNSTFRIETKARQIAWSWAAAAESLAAAIVDGESSLYTSINLQEAAGKIDYARALYEHIAEQGRVRLPRIIKDNTTQIRLDNGAEVLSLPSRPPRGKSRYNLYFDEFAHAMRDREIFKGGMPVISKGGRLRIGSSPFGASGMFWEIDTESIQKYPDFVRSRTPWWHVYAFCSDPIRAILKAPALATQDRVELFGNERIQTIFRNVPIEDFQAEYECIYVDETTAWIPWDEIKAAQRTAPAAHLATARGKNLAALYDAIAELSRDVAAGKVESIFGAGMDIGRTRNTSELTLCGIGRDHIYPLRLQLTMDNVEYDDQEAIAAHVAKTFRLTKMYIDRNGIGSQLAENLAKAFPTKIEGVDFTNASKTAWATQVKMLIQQGRAPIPVDRDLAYQIHSIKKIILPSKKLAFDTARNERHHADKFWGWVLALDAAMLENIPAPRPPLSSMSQRIAG